MRTDSPLLFVSKATASRAFRLLVVLVLVVGLTNCSDSSNRKQREAEAAKIRENITNRWINLKPVPISIPKEGEGEAVLTRNFYFIMDGSGSMREPATSNCGGDQKFENKMMGARWAIKQFLGNVPDDVNIGLYVFDHYGQREVVPLGVGNRSEFIRAIDQIRASGGTPLAQAIQFSTDQLVRQYRKQLGYGEFRLVVVTDGIAEQIPQAALYAARFGMPIYTIGLCVGQTHPLRQFSVSYRAADNFADLSKGLQDTLAELPDSGVTEFEN